MRAVVGLRRLAQIGTVAVRHGLARLFGGRLRRLPWLARRLPPGDLEGPELLRTLLEELGGTFVKLGQMLALQPDIVSLEYCNALFKLLDRIEPFPFSDVERILFEEHGKSSAELFDSIDPEPLATASIAQVHVAYLEGEKVAVKVQRPTIREDFAGDIGLMKLAIRLVQGLRLKPLMWIVEPLNEFIVWSDAELDFRQEARYMARIGRNAENNPIQVVPKVYSRLTTRRLMVVEFLDGVTLLAYLRALERGDDLLPRRLREIGFEPAVFAGNIIDNFLGDAYKYGAYHADLHPANLMILEDNRVGYVDFGITGVLAPYGRQHLTAMTLALARGDMEGLSEHFLLVSVRGSGADIERFRAGLGELAEGWFEGGSSQRHLSTNITRVMGDMLHLSRRTGILPARDIIKYIRSAIALDGLISRFAPGFDIGHHLATVSARFIAGQTRRERFAPDRLLEWSGAGQRLLRDGSLRTVRALDHLSRAGEPQDAESRDREARGTTAAMRTLQLGVAALVVALLMVVTPGPPTFGFNLWTAQLMVVGAFGAAALRAIWHLE